MKKHFFLFLALLCLPLGGVGGQAWAEDIDVDDDSKLRAAIAKDGANITVTANIDLSNSTLNIAEGKTVTIDLKGHTLDRGLTARSGTPEARSSPFAMVLRLTSRTVL